MTRYIITAILFFQFFALQSQTVIPARNEKGIWGAIDIARNNVITFEYQKVSIYAKDFILVEKDRKKGLYSKDGNLILSVKYDAIIPLNNSYFKVFNNGKLGVVGINDEIILPLSFKTIIFNESLNSYIVSNEVGNYVYSINGEEILSAGFDNISFYGDDAYLFRKGKKFAVSRSPENVSKLSYYDNIMGIGGNYLVSDNSKYGIIDEEGRIIIECKYSDIELLGTKYFAVRKNSEYAFFNLSGERMSSYSYSKPFHYFNNDVVWAREDDMWSRFDLEKFRGEDLLIDRIIDKQGDYLRVVENNYVVLYTTDEEKLFEDRFHNVLPVNDSLFKVQFDRKWGVFSIDGDEVLEIKYDDILVNRIVKEQFYDDRVKMLQMHDNSGRVKYSELFELIELGKYGIADLNGEIIVPAIYDKLGASQYESVIWVNRNNKYGVYNRLGEHVLGDTLSNVSWNEFQKRFIVKTDTSYKIIDVEMGRSEIKGVDNLEWSNKSELLFFSKDGYKGLIEATGKVVVDAKYDSYYDLGKDFFIGAMSESVDLYYKSGKLISEDKFLNAELLNHNEGNFVKVKTSSGKVGVYNREGKVIIPIKYEDVKLIPQDLFEVREDGKLIGYYDLKGNKYF